MAHRSLAVITQTGDIREMWGDMGAHLSLVVITQTRSTPRDLRVSLWIGVRVRVRVRVPGGA